MKKGVILLLTLSLLTIFLSVNFISAVISCSVTAGSTCATGETRVMGLTGVTNAHGQNNSYSDYPQSLCCSGQWGQNATCNVDGSNKILGLSSATNAHAEGPAGASYSVNVCYGYLSCRLETSQCSGDYLVEVLSLSSSTNAHIGAFSAYNTKICCKDNTPFLIYCDLTDARWAGLNPEGEIQEGHTAIMDLDGINCRGQGADEAINFSIWEDRAIFADKFVTWINGNFPSDSWPVSTPGNYYFNASSFNSGDWFDSRDGTGEGILTVIPNPEDDQCAQVQVCEDVPVAGSLTPQIDCNSNNGNTYCNLDLSLDDRVDENPPQGYSYNCTWIPATSSCNFTEYYGGPGEDEDGVLCGNGQTLCYAPDTQLEYCYPGDSCPVGEEHYADGDGICEQGEGCANPDCLEGEQDSCVTGTTCIKGASPIEGMCYSAGASKNETACENGYNLCYNAAEQVNYCYPDTGCPGADIDIDNECIPPAQDIGGICSNTALSLGRCIKGYISSGDNCDDGFLTYSWTATWEGSNRPAWCTSGAATIECPAQIPLPLFTPINAVITISAIITIYLILALAKNSKKKKRI